MLWIGLNHKKKKRLEHPKKSNDAAEEQKGLETLYCLVGESRFAYIYIYIFIYLLIYLFIYCKMSSHVQSFSRIAMVLVFISPNSYRGSYFKCRSELLLKGSLFYPGLKKSAELARLLLPVNTAASVPRVADVRGGGFCGVVFWARHHWSRLPIFLAAWVSLNSDVACERRAVALLKKKGLHLEVFLYPFDVHNGRNPLLIDSLCGLGLLGALVFEDPWVDPVTGIQKRFSRASL